MAAGLDLLTDGDSQGTDSTLKLLNEVPGLNSIFTGDNQIEHEDAKLPSSLALSELGVWAALNAKMPHHLTVLAAVSYMELYGITKEAAWEAAELQALASKYQEIARIHQNARDNLFIILQYLSMPDDYTNELNTLVQEGIEFHQQQMDILEQQDTDSEWLNDIRKTHQDYIQHYLLLIQPNSSEDDTKKVAGLVTQAANSTKKFWSLTQENLTEKYPVILRGQGYDDQQVNRLAQKLAGFDLLRYQQYYKQNFDPADENSVQALTARIYAEILNLDPNELLPLMQHFAQAFQLINQASSPVTANGAQTEQDPWSLAAQQLDRAFSILNKTS